MIKDGQGVVGVERRDMEEREGMIKEGQGGTGWNDKGGAGRSREEQGGMIKEGQGGTGWNDKGGAGRSRVA
jgi:hypothetical protein